MEGIHRRQLTEHPEKKFSVGDHDTASAQSRGREPARAL